MTGLVTSPADADPVGALFASSSLVEHLLRGVLGALLVVGGLVLAGQSAWALLAIPLGLVAWRGCPTCWALGLVATLSGGRGGCADGSCRADDDLSLSRRGVAAPTRR